MQFCSVSFDITASSQFTQTILFPDTPDDFLLATEETHSVREFVELSFTTAGRRIEWRGTGTDECGFDAANGDVLVGVDTRYFRPTEVAALHGDPSKACSVLGWHHKTGFEDLAKEMVATDLAAAKRKLRANGA